MNGAIQILRMNINLKLGTAMTHLIVFWVKPDPGQVKCFLRSNMPVSPKVPSIDKHKCIIPTLERWRHEVQDKFHVVMVNLTHWRLKYKI